VSVSSRLRGTEARAQRESVAS